MQQNDIENKLKEKYTDEFTVKVFTNFVMEFQTCFSNVMSTEELINRIKTNILGNIVIVDSFSNQYADGKYDEDGHVYLKKSSIKNERYIKYLLFHEMIHALTSFRDENGKEIIFGFSNRKTSIGKGFNEAMAEYLTQVRNQKFEPNSDDLIANYRVIMEQLKKLMLIVGEEKLFQCFFYEPNKLNDLLKEYNIDYDELELAFYKLCNQDQDIYNIATSNKLNDIMNYKLYKYTNTIFNCYCKSLGEVDSLNKFKRKYEILKSSYDKEYGEILTISPILINFYSSIKKDIDTLITTGINFEEIKPILNDLKININTMLIIDDFSKCFTDDKNNSAISLYEFYKKNPDIYYKLFKSNYGMMFDHFSESGVNINEHNLYDGYRYISLGAFLKEHPEFEYCNVSFEYISERNCGIRAYIFTDDETDKQYIYNFNGTPIKTITNENGENIFVLASNDKFECYLKYNDRGLPSYSFKSVNNFPIEKLNKRIKLGHQKYLSEKEELEYCIDQGFDHKGNLSEKLYLIEKRIREKKKTSIIK